MKKMITLLFSFGLIFVGSVGASDGDQLTSIASRKTSSVSVDIAYTHNLKSNHAYMGTYVEFSSGENYYSTKEIENDSVTVRYRDRQSNKNISAEQFKSIQQKANSLLQSGYCQTLRAKGDYYYGSTLIPSTIGEEIHSYSSEDQCLQALSEYQAALAARKKSGQA